MPKPEFNLPPNTQITAEPNSTICFQVDQSTTLFVNFDRHGRPQMPPHFHSNWQRFAGEEGEIQALYIYDDLFLLRLVNGVLYTGDFAGTWNDVLDQYS